MTPLERAARALWEANGSPMKARDAAPAMRPPEDQPDWQRFIPQARAVIEAVREPSVTMVSEGDSGLGVCTTSVIWPMMIDVLLEEGR